MEPRHRTKTSIASGDDTVRYEYDGKMRWSVRDSGIEMDLEVEEYVPPVDGHRREGVASAEGFLGAHIDASCDVSGTLKVKGKTYQIKNAYAVRDHAWGPRAWKALLSHRWTIATLDRHNSFVAMNLLSEGSPHASFGWVFRDDKVIFAKKVDIKAIIGMDGGTNYGGTTRLTLTTGEIFEVKFEPYYPCVASRVYNVLAYDALCRASWGDKVGFGVFETSNNLQGGTLQPEVFEDAYGPDGWHEAKLLMAGC